MCLKGDASVLQEQFAAVFYIKEGEIEPASPQIRLPAGMLSQKSKIGFGEVAEDIAKGGKARALWGQ